MICWKQVDCQSFWKKNILQHFISKKSWPHFPSRRTFEFTELPQAPEEMEGQVTLRSCWDTQQVTHTRSMMYLLVILQVATVSPLMDRP